MMNSIANKGPCGGNGRFGDSRKRTPTCIERKMKTSALTMPSHFDRRSDIETTRTSIVHSSVEQRQEYVKGNRIEVQGWFWYYYGLLAICVFCSSFYVARTIMGIEKNAVQGTRNIDIPTKFRGTGSYASCAGRPIDVEPYPFGPNEKRVTVSCLTMSYRKPPITATNKEVFVGVLSNSGGDGPKRRATIRQTWGSEHPNVQIYYVVAGPWDDIKDEYNKHQDMLWLGIGESYDHLTYKSLAFQKILHDEATALTHHNIKFIFKTDDDVFVNVDYLQNYLMKMKNPVDYWGDCLPPWSPIRDITSKWKLSVDVYPEKFFPPYCVGPGYAISMKFLACAAAGPKDHIASLRYMLGLEDVAVGMLAERCAIEPVNADSGLTSRSRFFVGNDLWEEEGRRMEKNLPKIDREKLPDPQVDGKIWQHALYDDQDFFDHWYLLNNVTSPGAHT